jgi:intergrase/recombinase
MTPLSTKDDERKALGGTWTHDLRFTKPSQELLLLLSSRVQIPARAAEFRNWLASQGKRHWTIKEIVNYSKKYGHILDTGDASPLLVLSPRNRHHALTALANLSKFQGRYTDFQQLRQRYSLKWSKADFIQHFQRFFDPQLSLENILQRIAQMRSILPSFMARIIDFACLTGLRPAEVVESVRLINDSRKLSTYYNPDRSALEHFRFPEIFLRQTKKAYISFVTPEMIEGLGKFPDPIPSYNAIRLACRRKGFNMDMRYCRKIYASWLHQHGIPSEEIDFLQGRTSPSVFSRHYLSPTQDLKHAVLTALEKLSQQLNH